MELESKKGMAQANIDKLKFVSLGIVSLVENDTINEILAIKKGTETHTQPSTTYGEMESKSEMNRFKWNRMEWKQSEKAMNGIE